MFDSRQKIKGFTLIELLVVIAIIALLSSVLFASLSTARMKARDAKRVADIKQILMALQIYQDRYGCIPKTSGSTCGIATGMTFLDSGGWDYSSQGSSFLPFLSAGTEPIMKIVPIDPINDMPGNATVGTYAYRYFCYSVDPNLGLSLGYWRETSPAGLTLATKHLDPEFTCK